MLFKSREVGLTQHLVSMVWQKTENHHKNHVFYVTNCLNYNCCVLFFDLNPRRKDCSTRRTYLFPTCEFKRKSVQRIWVKRIRWSCDDIEAYYSMNIFLIYIFLVLFMLFLSSKLIIWYVDLFVFLRIRD